MTMAPSTANPVTRVVAGVAPGTGLEDRPDRPKASASMLDAVADLRRDVAATGFPLPLPGVPAAEARRVALLDQLDDHLLPRLRELSAPAVVVVAGSTGAGKSTIVNSVVGSEVSAAGVLRPTTRRPVLVHHPGDAELLVEHPLRDVVDVVESGEVARGIALVDAPDLDSLVEVNRVTAHRLLEAADLWLFVTTAARYGDALPWQVLDQAARRGTSMAMVLNRVPADALVTVRGELMGRLRSRGMAAVPLFLVKDLGPHEGLLPPAAVTPIRRWLATVAGPDRARAVIARTQRGAVAALRPWVDDLAEAVQDQVDAAERLGAVVAETLERTASAAVASAREGAVVTGPVRGRWVAAAGRGLLARRVPRRRRADRDTELAALADDVVDSLKVVLAQARAAGGAAVRAAIEAAGLPGAEGVLDALDTYRHVGPTAVIGAVPQAGTGDGTRGADGADAHHAARRWADDARARWAAGARTAERRLGPGAVGVVLAAGAGLEPAATLLDEVDPDTAGVVASLREALDEAVRAQVVAGAAPASAVLATEDLAADAASRLRLRAAVLKAVR